MQHSENSGGSGVGGYWVFCLLAFWVASTIAEVLAYSRKQQAQLRG